MSLYRMGQIVETQYTNAPVPAEQKWPIGTTVTILGEDGEELAEFEVIETGNVIVRGIITAIQE